MFKNSGKKIKAYALVVFIIELVLAVGYCIAMIVLDADAGADGLLAIAGIFGAALLGFVAYISSLFVYAFGELADETLKQSADFKENNALLRKIAVALKADVADAPAAPAASADHFCANCGAKLPDDSSFCTSCGARQG